MDDDAACKALWTVLLPSAGPWRATVEPQRSAKLCSALVAYLNKQQHSSKASSESSCSSAMSARPCSQSCITPSLLALQRSQRGRRHAPSQDLADAPNLTAALRSDDTGLAQPQSRAKVAGTPSARSPPLKPSHPRSCSFAHQVVLPTLGFRRTHTARGTQGATAANWAGEVHTADLHQLAADLQVAAMKMQQQAGRWGSGLQDPHAGSRLGTEQPEPARHDDLQCNAALQDGDRQEASTEEAMQTVRALSREIVSHLVRQENG